LTKSYKKKKKNVYQKHAINSALNFTNSRDIAYGRRSSIRHAYSILAMTTTKLQNN